jgi:hypothetical protein
MCLRRGVVCTSKRRCRWRWNGSGREGRNREPKPNTPEGNKIYEDMI